MTMRLVQIYSPEVQKVLAQLDELRTAHIESIAKVTDDEHMMGVIACDPFLIQLNQVTIKTTAMAIPVSVIVENVEK